MKIRMVCVKSFLFFLLVFSFHGFTGERISLCQNNPRIPPIKRREIILKWSECHETSHFRTDERYIKWLMEIKRKRNLEV